MSDQNDENNGNQPNTSEGSGIPNTETLTEVSQVEFQDVLPKDSSHEELVENSKKNLEMIYEIPVRVYAELGHTNLTIKDLLTLGPGSVIEMERLAGETIDLLVNGVLIGKGDVVVVNENFGLRITEIVCLEERIKRITE